MTIYTDLPTLADHLPLSSSPFARIRKDDLVYVDKTAYIEKLVKKGTSQYVFLSRPRRFGKSLLLDTIEQLFEGEEKLFHGLYIYDKWNWEDKYVVIHLDFSSLEVPYENENDPIKEDLEDCLRAVLLSSAGLLGIILEPHTKPHILFRDFIHKAYLLKKKPVVILIDEYDIPIISNVTRPTQADVAKKIMHSFYKELKANGKYLHFVMITGISKFAGVSVFSALNNLVDISLKPAFSAICGYTEAELDKYFAPFMTKIDRNEFRGMYNGYNWLGESVYNPIDVMTAISDAVSFGRFSQFKSYWFGTGTPTFLTDLMRKRGSLIPDLKGPGIVEDQFTKLDVNNLSVEALLFQTGYLTIDKHFYDQKRGMDLYYLKYPNVEVLTSFNNFFLSEIFTEKEEEEAYYALGDGLCEALNKGDCQMIFDEIHIFFASLSHRWYTNNTMASAEGFYCGMLYAILQSNAGYVEVEAESQTNHGQIDLFIRVKNKRYIIEVKVGENARGASGLDQILEKGYAEKFHNDDELYLMGMEFSSEERNITKLEYCVGKDGERMVITGSSQKSSDE